MYDHKREISGEDPEHIKWIYEVAIPRFEEWGYKVYVVKSKYDYVSLFHKVTQRSKIPERNGKVYGFPMSGRCYINSSCKAAPIDKFAKEHNYDINIRGIAIDEPKRLSRLHEKEGVRSYLEEFNYTEQQAYDLCKEHNLLSPLYKNGNREGVGFAPISQLNTMRI